MRRALHRRIVAPLLVLAVSLLAGVSPAGGQLGPQTVVRQFCQADGLGQRASLPNWAAVAPLVTWIYEPAWDHVMLISSYTVDSPRSAEPMTLLVDVHYQVTGQVSARGVDPQGYVETVTFQVTPYGTGWRIAGPPPPPHIFGDSVDVDAMRRSLEQGGVNFIADSLFVWRMFQAAGWNVDFEATGDLPDGPLYRAVDQPLPGDVVAYLRDGSPYHIGLLEADDQVVSSTLNAGIVRTAIDAFTGEVKYLRLVQPNPAPPPVRLPAYAGMLAPQAPIAPPQPRRTPTPVARKEKPRPGKAPARRTPQPTHGKRARTKAKTRKKARRPTPTPKRR